MTETNAREGAGNGPQNAPERQTGSPESQRTGETAQERSGGLNATDIHNVLDHMHQRDRANHQRSILVPEWMAQQYPDQLRQFGLTVYVADENQTTIRPEDL